MMWIRFTEAKRKGPFIAVVSFVYCIAGQQEIGYDRILI